MSFECQSASPNSEYPGRFVEIASDQPIRVHWCSFVVLFGQAGAQVGGGRREESIFRIAAARNPEVASI
jgi:hypothetical protein